MAFPTGNSGFPKSHNVSKGIDKALGTEGSVDPTGNPVARMIPGADQDKTGSWIKDSGRTYQPGEYVSGSDQAAQWQGWGTALKPAYEPITIARKPLVGTVARNVMQHGTGAINIDGCRVGDTGGTRKAAPEPERKSVSSYGNGLNGGGCCSTGKGRHPANLMHDGCLQFPGGAERFFYCPKASKADRDDGLSDVMPKPSAASEFRPNHTEKAEAGETWNPYGRWKPQRNIHPTVKPTELMRYLCRLVTPPGGVVLDPFAGSGSTGRGAVLEGFKFIGIEQDPEYAEIARLRVTACQP